LKFRAHGTIHEQNTTGAKKFQQTGHDRELIET
jgi:hypothetical protein